jgi:hypothetical protein
MTTDASAPTATPSSPKQASPKQAATIVPLRLAAGAMAAEAVGMLVATGFSAAATIDGKSYHTANGIALTVFAFIGALAAAGLAYAITQAKPWSRTPALICQLLAVIGGIMLVEGHRLDWGVPTLILAAATTGGLLAPASLRALNRQLLVRGQAFTKLRERARQQPGHVHLGDA